MTSTHRPWNCFKFKFSELFVVLYTLVFFSTGYTFAKKAKKLTTKKA